MATTTNYGWSTPDDTSLVKDGASAIRTLGSSIDTTTKALNPSTTLGDIEYRSSTANTNTRLGIGSTGQVLSVVGGVPSWTTVAGGGKVLQVVSATYSTETGNSTSTYQDTGLTASITPSSSSSKILVMVSQAGNRKSNNDTYMDAQLLRGSTVLAYFIAVGGANGGTAANYFGTAGYTYLDSPATTSSTTYKTQFRSGAGNAAVATQVSSALSTITLLEIGA